MLAMEFSPNFCIHNIFLFFFTLGIKYIYVCKHK